MPPVACIPTKTARRALEQLGYKLIDEDEYNWVFALRDDDVPILLPHGVPFVPMDIMQQHQRLLNVPPTAEEQDAAVRADTDD